MTDRPIRPLLPIDTTVDLDDTESILAACTAGDIPGCPSCGAELTDAVGTSFDWYCLLCRVGFVSAEL